jgi:hypothetical protein
MVIFSEQFFRRLQRDICSLKIGGNFIRMFSHQKAIPSRAALRYNARLPDAKSDAKTGLAEIKRSDSN